MYNITLIGTQHLESGKCNSDELYKIIESINPDVIFEEMPSSHFNAYYVTKTQRSLESDTINQYFKSHNVKIIPVDIDVRQELSKYQNEINFIFHTIFKHEDYLKLDNEKDDLMIQKGFRYLNSDEFLDFLEKKKVIEKQIIESEPDKDRLLNIYKLFHLVQYDSRENAMLQNIYNYSKENQYNQAVFLLGAGHRKSIMKKITEYEKLSGIKLNWTTYGDY
ncbi:MAG: hypothetical protein ACI7YS_00755 [Flavobacterium sp.]